MVCVAYKLIKLFFCECFMLLPLFLKKLEQFQLRCHFCLWKSAYIKFSTVADILSYKIIMVTDITILFSDLVSLIVPLQTWNVKY